MKFLSEGEIMSSSFHITISINVRGKRKYTEPVIVRYREMDSTEQLLLTNLILKYAKKKSKASRSERSDPSVKKVQRQKSIRKQKRKRRI